MAGCRIADADKCRAVVAILLNRKRRQAEGALQRHIFAGPPAPDGPSGQIHFDGGVDVGRRCPDFVPIPRQLVEVCEQRVGDLFDKSQIAVEGENRMV